MVITFKLFNPVQDIGNKELMLMIPQGMSKIVKTD